MSTRIFKTFILSALVTLSGCGGKSLLSIPGPSMVNIYPHHRLTALERRNATDSFLVKNKISATDGVELMPDYTTARLRDQRAVARKAVVLFALTNVAFHYQSAADITDYLKKYDLWIDVPEKARKYLALPRRTVHDDNPYIWRSESFNTLFWALGHFKTLPFPSAPCDITRYGGLPDLSEDPSAWINSARLRNSEEVLNEMDLIFRMHQSVYEAIISKRSKGLLNEDVLSERRLALDWLLLEPYNSAQYTHKFF